MSLEKALGLVRSELDIASADDQRRVRDLADELLAAALSAEELLERGRGSATPIDLALASKLALSKRAVDSLAWSGGVATVRARGADHDQEMAAVVDEFADAATLDKVITRVPDALVGVPDADLGQRAAMSALELREWLEGVRASPPAASETTKR